MCHFGGMCIGYMLDEDVFFFGSSLSVLRI